MYYLKVKTFNEVITAKSGTLAFAAKQNKPELAKEIAKLITKMEIANKTEPSHPEIILDTVEALINEYPLATLADIGLFFGELFKGKYRNAQKVDCLNILTFFAQYWEQRIQYAIGKSYDQYVNQKDCYTEDRINKDIISLAKKKKA